MATTTFEEKVYSTDLSNQQREIIRPLLPQSPPIGDDRTVDIRKVANGIVYLNRTNCQWRIPPEEYEHRNTTFSYYNRWRKDGTWDRIHEILRNEVRLKNDRQPSPSAAVIDSQSVKTIEKKGVEITTRARRFPVASGTSWSIRSDCCS